LMPADIVSAIIDEVAKQWRISNDIEITLEANPTSVEAAKLTEFKIAGVNRVSMGIQALNDIDLKRLGRLHSVREALQAFDISRNIFNSVSFDLIYARQNQSLKSWQHELRQALDLSLDHLSLYQLTVENGTRFGELYDRGKLEGLPDDEKAADMYQATCELCANAGLNNYEVRITPEKVRNPVIILFIGGMVIMWALARRAWANNCRWCKNSNDNTTKSGKMAYMRSI
jgi:coproporphyrinogen III oxidase-like Fe-S oxidoreductase